MNNELVRLTGRTSLGFPLLIFEGRYRIQNIRPLESRHHELMILAEDASAGEIAILRTKRVVTAPGIRCDHAGFVKMSGQNAAEQFLFIPLHFGGKGLNVPSIEANCIY